MSWIDTLGTLLLWTWSLYETWDAFNNNQADYNGYIFSLVSVIEANYNNDNYNTTTYSTIYANWDKYWNSRKTAKIYTIQWYLVEASCEALEVEIDAMTKACSQRNKQFRLKRRDGTIIFSNASVAISFEERFDTSFFMPYTATVTVYDGNMYWSVINEQSYEDTVANISTTITNTQGNEQWLPYILLECKVWNTLTSVTVIVWESSLTVPVALISTDTLLINSRSGEILKNWSPLLGWTWTLPVLEIWSNTFQVLFVGSPNVDVYFMTYPQYA